MVLHRPYGYMINKHKEFEIVPTEAEIVRTIFKLYNEDGWDYKKIANYLTDIGIPPECPSRCENKPRARKANGR